MRTKVFNKEKKNYISVLYNQNIIDKITNEMKDSWVKMLNYVSERVECSTIVVSYLTETHIKEYVKCDKVYQTRIYEDNTLRNGLLCETVISNNGSLFVEDVNESDLWVDNQGGLFKSKSYFGLPIKLVNEEVFGTVAIIGDDKLELEPRIKVLLRMVRDSIEKDLHILYMKDHISNLVITDPLSGLYNKRKVDEIVFEYQAELYRSISFLSIAIIKLGNYEEIRTKFGDKTAENMIALLGRIFKNRARIVDRIGVLAIDEFIIISKGSKSDGQEVLLRDLKKYAERHLELSEYAIEFNYVNIQVNENENIEEAIESLNKKIKT